MIPSSPGRDPFLVVTLCSLLLLTVGACRTAGGSPSLSEPSGESLFDFRIDFGMNLHHFLFWTANPHGRTPSEGVPLAWPDDLEPAEQAVVDGAVGYYRETFGGKDLLFTQDLMAIKFALIEHDGSDDFASSSSRLSTFGTSKRSPRSTGATDGTPIAVPPRYFGMVS